MGVCCAATSDRSTSASVKPNKSGELMIRLDTETGGRFLAVNAPLRTLIQLAYGLEDRDHRCSGLGRERALRHPRQGDAGAPAARGTDPWLAAGEADAAGAAARAVLTRTHTETRELQGLALMLSAIRRPSGASSDAVDNRLRRAVREGEARRRASPRVRIPDVTGIDRARGRAGLADRVGPVWSARSPHRRSNTA